MANKEIAAGRYASEKAVAYHPRNVYGYCQRLLPTATVCGKLGISLRREFHAKG
jgi:hypothetical protein